MSTFYLLQKEKEEKKWKQKKLTPDEVYNELDKACEEVVATGIGLCNTVFDRLGYNGRIKEVCPIAAYGVTHGLAPKATGESGDDYMQKAISDFGITKAEVWAIIHGFDSITSSKPEDFLKVGQRLRAKYIKRSFSQ